MNQYEGSDVGRPVRRNMDLTSFESRITHPLDHEVQHRWRLPAGAMLPGPVTIIKPEAQ